MLLKGLFLVLWVGVTAICGFPDKFMIKNEKTGLVLDGAGKFAEMGDWTTKKSQVWTIENSSTPGYYYIRNMANQKVLDACPVTKAVLIWQKHGGKNQMWKIDAQEGTRVEVKFYPNHYLMDSNRKPILYGTKQDDNADKWVLAEIPEVPPV